MQRVGIVAAVAFVVTGCVTPIVFENPTTRQRVNCTLEAERLAYNVPVNSTGADVPGLRRGSPTVHAFDIEQQCAGTLLREGYVCVSGCANAPR